MLTAVFRTSIIESIPSAVGSRLEDVVGLESKPIREFEDHVAHTVAKCRKGEHRLTEQ